MTTKLTPPTMLSAPDQCLKYYAECRQFLLIMGQKYTSLLAQASVFAFAASAVITTTGHTELLGQCGLMTVAYFGQIRIAGSIMTRIEREQLGFVCHSGWGLIGTIRESWPAYFGRTLTLVFVVLYLLALVGLVIAVAIVTAISRPLAPK